ncbi:GGDEF domain-containing protein [Acidihalobacter aeolianus]|nr:diguanylate cyclase [Acidihalobacter aeolianus]
MVEVDAQYTVTGCFADSHMEAAFRRAHLGWITGRLIVGGLVGGALYWSVLFHDHVVQEVNHSHLQMLGRLAVLLAGIWLAYRAYVSNRKGSDPPLISLLIFELILAGSFLFMVSLHNANVEFHAMSMLVIVALLYMFLPSLWPIEMLLPWLFSLAFLALSGFDQADTVADRLVLVFLVLVVNALGTYFVRVINRGQRSEYLTVQALQSMNNELGQKVIDYRQVEERLRASEDNLQHLFDAAPVPLVLTRDRDGALLRINRAASALLGIESDHNLSSLFTPGFYEDLREREWIVGRLRSVGVVDGIDIHLRTIKGKPVEAILTAVRTEYDGETVYFVALVDISERKRIERELQRLASTDTLTGLHNRRSFFALAETEIKRAKRKNGPLSLLLLDVDNFKNINDRFGHSVGDAALGAIVDAVTQCLRDYDIAARIGGEEFAVLLPDVPQTGAMEVAERVREAIEHARFTTPAGPFSLTVSIGVAPVSTDAATIDRALSLADDALYVAKRAGRNRVSLAANSGAA